MESYQFTTHIGAPPERVFELYTDVHRIKEWQPGVRAVTGVTGPLDQVGARYTLVVGPWPARSRVEITRVQRPVLHEERVRALGIKATVTARFAPAQGGTDLTFEWSFRVPWWMGGRLLERFITRDGGKTSRLEIGLLKQLAEKEAGG